MITNIHAVDISEQHIVQPLERTKELGTHIRFLTSYLLFPFRCTHAAVLLLVAVNLTRFAPGCRNARRMCRCGTARRVALFDCSDGGRVEWVEV